MHAQVDSLGKGMPHLCVDLGGVEGEAWACAEGRLWGGGGGVKEAEDAARGAADQRGQHGATAQ